MHVTLLHNPESGDERHSKDRLLELLSGSGYDPAYHQMGDDFEASLPSDPGALVVIAGGDGTLDRAIQAIAPRADSRRRVPLAVLPLGTANNIARALGWTGTPEEAIRAWPQAKPRPFDVGLAQGPWGRKPFLEAAGLGLFPEAMERLSRHKKQNADHLNSAEEALAHDLRMMATLLETHRARRFQLTLDGEDLSGEYLMVEAMNLEAVGPRLRLNAKADSADGVFELVALTEAERPLLAAHLASYADAVQCRGRRPPPVPQELTVRRGKRLHIDWQGQPLHADSQVWQHDDPTGPPASVEVHLQARALRFLTRS